MVILLVLILGSVSLMRLPIDLMPDITSPTLTIRTLYENASPEEIEELITRPIEEAMSAVPGVESVYSISSEGSAMSGSPLCGEPIWTRRPTIIRDRIWTEQCRSFRGYRTPTLYKFDIATFPS